MDGRTNCALPLYVLSVLEGVTDSDEMTKELLMNNCTSENYCADGG